MTTIINLLGLAFMFAINYAVFFYSKGSGQLNWQGTGFPFTQFVSVAVLMLLGIVFGCLFRQIRQRGKERVLIMNELQKVWTSPSLWRALLVSPVVFGILFLIVRDNPGSGPALLLAFQNGFFCESVFKKKFQPDSDG